MDIKTANLKELKCPKTIYGLSGIGCRLDLASSIRLVFLLSVKTVMGGGATMKKSALQTRTDRLAFLYFHNVHLLFPFEQMLFILLTCFVFV